MADGERRVVVPIEILSKLVAMTVSLVAFKKIVWQFFFRNNLSKKY